MSLEVKIFKNKELLVEIPDLPNESDLKSLLITLRESKTKTNAYLTNLVESDKTKTPVAATRKGYLPVI